MLKKITAILLLGLFLFNWVGYRLLTYYLEARADMQLQARLDDNNYEETQLISVKTPITHLSYYHNSPEFETTGGKIEIGGIQYKYVKRRIYNDSLEVLCIPDAAAMKLKAVKNAFFAFVNGLQQGGHEKKQSANSNISKDISVEYYPVQGLPFGINNVWRSFTKRYVDNFFPLSSIYTLVPEHPPKVV
ncbi:MAG: hypothetical protein J0H74_06815 [Chitinophagaceae bacterium]|nr:hypothetical protein [Chitinophagaceae bacterium]